MACKYTYKGNTYTKEEFESFVKENLVKKSPENQFLNLLGKNNNWVTFFVKSIIQDSVKKGYEKVLFPKGDTAARIEGHQTLEEFKKQKEDRIKELKEEKKLIDTNDRETRLPSGFSLKYTTLSLEEIKDNNIRETERLKQELADVEAGKTQLSSIAKFYENTITNILKKNYDIKNITDEFGNEWTEVDLINKKIKNTDFNILLKEQNDKKTVDKSILYTKKTSKANNKINDNISEENLNSNLNKIRDIFFNGSITNISANELLRNAYKKLDLNDDTKKIVKTLLTTKAKIKFTSGLKTSSTAAQYLPNSRTIELNRDVVGKMNEYYFFETILHEVIHDFTANILLNPKNDKQREFRNQVEFWFNNYYVNSENNYLYGFTNMHEFLSEVISNPIFREEIDNISIENKSLLKRIIELFKKLFGISSPNSSEIIKSILDIAETEYNNQILPIQSQFTLEKREEEKEKYKKNYSKEYKEKLYSLDKILNKIQSDIDSVFSKSAAVRGKDSDTAQRFKEVDQLIKEFAKVSTHEAIYKFVEFANEELYKLKISISNKSREESLTSDYLFRAKSYTAIYNSLDDIKRTLQNQYENNLISEEEYNKINDSIKSARNNYIDFNNSYLNNAKDQITTLLAPFNTKPEDRRRRELEREYNSLGLKENKEQWILDRLNNEIEDLKIKAFEEIREMLDTVPMDIGSTEAFLSSEKNINNLLLKTLSVVLDKIEHETRDTSVQLRNLANKKLNEYNPKGSNNKQKYSKLLSTDSSGNYYFISEYKPEFLRKHKELIHSKNNAFEEFGKKSEEYKKARKELRTWEKNNIIYDSETGSIISPKDKWINKDYQKLPKKDKEYLDFLISQIKQADEDTLGYKSLIFKDSNAEFIVPPSITQSSFDKIMSGQLKNWVQTGLKDFHKVRADRTEGGELQEVDSTASKYVSVMSTVNNEERLLVPIHFRNKIDPKDQSLDLPTIVLMNSVMAKEFKAKHNIEAESNLLLDVIGESKVQKTQSVSRKWFASVFSRDQKNPDIIRVPGTDSNLYKKLENVIQNRVYNILDSSSGRVSSDRLNLISQNVMKYTADVTLAANWLSALPNMVQGKLQNFIESVGGNTFTKKDLLWAEKTYWQEMGKEGFADIGSTINNSKLNLMIDKFNILTDFGFVKHDFERTNKFKALFNTKSLHAFNNMAEHYAQSTLMLSIMSNIKMMNKNQEYIDINGNVVEKNKAMNFYDAFTVIDGDLKLNKNVNTTSFRPTESIDENGMIQIQNLIRKKIIDLHGQYDSKWQSTFQRYWFGKAISMFRKWLIPGFYRRWRGMYYIKHNYDDLIDNQQYYSLETGQFEEGTYTSFIRFIAKGIIPSLKEMKIELAVANWKQLTDSEKANIHKTIRELLITSMMFTAAWMTSLAAKDSSDEEEKELLFTLAYVFRRQESELMQYYSISDTLRIFRSPFAALNTIEDSYGLLNQMLPWNIGEQYKNGENKDEYKAWVKTKRLMPVLSQTERSAERSFSYLENLIN